MVTAVYHNYFLRILPETDSDRGAVTVKISAGEFSKPLVTLYVYDLLRTEGDGVRYGIEVGEKWIQETLPHLRWPNVEATLLQSRKRLAEMKSALAASRCVIEQSQELVLQSRRNHSTRAGGESPNSVPYR